MSLVVSRTGSSKPNFTLCVVRLDRVVGREELVRQCVRARHGRWELAWSDFENAVLRRARWNNHIYIARILASVERARRHFDRGCKHADTLDNVLFGNA